ncbi:MAG: hypothetical protein JWQ19_1526 [Subtercola sp.]|nr:hypothetical protein [Subtercola sp.]
MTRFDLSEFRKISLVEAKTYTLPRQAILVAVVCSLVFSSYVFECRVSANVVALPGAVQFRSTVQDLFPQGWAFFTKPVDAEIMHEFVQSGLETVEVGGAPNASWNYAFGWNRESRFEGIETAALLSGIGADSWTRCDPRDSRRECLSQAESDPIKVENRSPHRSLCGTVLISAEQTTDWAFRNLKNDTSVPIEALALKVTCS